jgi:hypothetical protein
MFTSLIPDFGVYFTEHASFESLHVRAENFPEPLLDHVTLPVGEEPITVAVHFVDVPTTEDELTQVTSVTELTVRAKLPLLPRLLESPR